MLDSKNTNSLQQSNLQHRANSAMAPSTKPQEAHQDQPYGSAAANAISLLGGGGGASLQNQTNQTNQNTSSMSPYQLTSSQPQPAP